MFFLPVETYAASLVLHGIGLQDGRHGIRHARKHAFVSALLLGLQHLPVSGHVFGAQCFCLGENVRMTINHLLAKLIHHICYVVLAFFFCDFGIEQDVQEYVPQLFLYVGIIFLHYRVAKFVDFFNCHRPKGVDGLSMVPGAFRAQAVHYVESPGKLLQFLLFRVHLGNISIIHSCKQI